MCSTLSYKPNDYANLAKLVEDKLYADSKDILVKQFDHLFVLKYNKSKFYRNIFLKERYVNFFE